MNDMQTMLENIDKKLDAIMEHLGCSPETSPEDYKNMTAEEKDATDAKEVLGKQQ